MSQITDEMLANAITRIALSFQDPQAFEALAAEAAQALEEEDLNRLGPLLAQPPAPPVEISALLAEAAEPGLWPELCREAVCALCFHFGEDAVPALMEMLRSGPEAARAGLADVLCRFAAQGIRREDTVALLAEQLPQWPYGDRMPALRSLSRIRMDEQVGLLFEAALPGEEDPFGRLLAIRWWMHAQPQGPIAYLPWLKALAMNPDARLAYRVQAGMLAHQLDADDASVIALLKGWAAECEDAEAQKQVRAYLGMGEGA